MDRKVQKPKPVAICFRCKACGGGVITKVIVARDPRKLLQWTCNLCKTSYGPVWDAEVWGERPGVLLHGLDPLPDFAVKEILAGTRGLLTRRPISKGEIVYLIAKGVVSLILAGVSILWQIRAYHI
jgi:hypothetical protein